MSAAYLASPLQRRKRPTNAELVFQRIAVTPAQIGMWGLPTRPTKASDTRAAKFTGESVKVDAIPASTLRRVLRAAIERHIDQRMLRLTEACEQSERNLLRAMIEEPA